MNAHGVRRGGSRSTEMSQWVLFPKSSKGAEAKENSAAGDLVLDSRVLINGSG